MNTISLIRNYPDLFIRKTIISIRQLKRNKRRYLKENDLYDLLNLLKLGISPDEGLKILLNGRNRPAVESIQKGLEKGEYFNRLFSDCLCLEDRKHFLIFNNYLGFEKSLSLTLEISKLKKDLFTNLISEMLYPLVLMIISLLGIYVFIYLAYPGITAVLSGFDYDFRMMDCVVSVIRIILNLIFIVMILVIGMILYSSVKKNRSLVFVILCRIKKNNIYQKYVTNMFIRYFNECVKTGLKTKDTLNLLSEIDDSLVVLEAYQLSSSLNRGDKLISAVDNDYLDDRMLRFFRMAAYSENLEDVLDRYIRFSDNSFKRGCKSYSRMIMAVSYLIIALMIVFIYQILFIPLEVLSTL